MKVKYNSTNYINNENIISQNGRDNCEKDIKLVSLLLFHS